jgi:hypothetical protein
MRSGIAALRNATSQNVNRVRARRQIKQNACRKKQSEIMNAKHGERLCLRKSRLLNSLAIE